MRTAVCISSGRNGINRFETPAWPIILLMSSGVSICSRDILCWLRACKSLQHATDCIGSTSTCMGTQYIALMSTQRKGPPKTEHALHRAGMASSIGQCRMYLLSSMAAHQEKSGAPAAGSDGSATTGVWGGACTALGCVALCGIGALLRVSLHLCKRVASVEASGSWSHKKRFRSAS